jgi:hypothetical protein
MSFALTRPSFAVGFEVFVLFTVEEVMAASSASLARSGLLCWLRDLRSPLNWRVLRRSGGVAERLLVALSGLLMSGVRSLLMFDNDFWLCALSGRFSALNFRAAAKPKEAPAIAAPASSSLTPLGRSALGRADGVRSAYLSSLGRLDDRCWSEVSDCCGCCLTRLLSCGDSA